jgi:hypothetical protein
VLNHFNSGNPNTTLNLNYSKGANTNANFGSITTAIGQSRHMALAVKFASEKRFTPRSRSSF